MINGSFGAFAAPALAVAAGLVGLLAIAADWEERRRPAFYVLKPLATLLIIGLAATAPLENEYALWVLAALGLALVGDVCLMFAGNRWFVAGLASFLLAHLAFVVAFLQDIGNPTLQGWLAGVVFVAVGLLVAFLPRAGALKLPVLVYCVVLTAMVFAAAARESALNDAASRLALAGALLFMVSDALLGWRRFVGRFRGAQAAILSTYWAAIGLIAWSV